MYKGNFKEDKKCGFGNQQIKNIVDFQNQQIKNINLEEDYTGEFYNNLRHGQGKLMTKIIDDKSNINYEIYIGQFVNNMKHGLGQLITEDKIMKGLWIENKFIHEE